MNARQQAALAHWQQMANDLGHAFVYDDRSPAHIAMRCSCGFVFTQRRINALARNSRIAAGVRQHYLKVIADNQKGTK